MSGLWNGAFLYSAADGHYEFSEESPRRAGALAFNTFVSAANVRILILLMEEVVWGHKGSLVEGGLMDTVPLEVGFGLVLMSIWRMLHSTVVPRY